MRNTSLLGSALLLSAALLTLRPAVAATVTWDTSTDAGFQAGSGNWSDLFWSADGTNLGAWTAGDSAIFLGEANAVTNTIALNTSQSLSGLSFGSATTSGNWTFTGSGMALSANSTFTINTGSLVTIGNVISGGFALTKAGGGGLTLTGVNAYTGNTSVTGGTLTVASGAALGRGILSLSGGASVVLNGSSTVSNLGGIGSISIASGTTLTLDAAGGYSFFGGTLSGTGALVKSGGSETVFTGNNSAYSGEITLNAGSLRAQNATNSFGTGDLTITGTASIGVSNAVLTGRIQNKIRVTAGTATLAGTWGTLIYANDVTFGGSSNVLFAQGHTIMTGNFTNTGTGNWSVSAGATLQLGNGGTTGSVDGGFAFSQASGHLAFNRTDDIVYSGVLSGAGNLTHAGTGKLTLTRLNTYAGTISVSAGSLIIAAGGSLGAGTVTVSGTGVIDLGGQQVANSFVVNGGSLRGGVVSVAKLTASSGAVSSELNGAGSFTKSGAGTLVFSGTNTYSGGTTITAGVLTVGTTTALGSGAVTLTGGTLNLNGQTIGNDLTLGAGVIDGSGTLTGVIGGTSAFSKSRSGALTFTRNNTYSGGTTISAGTLNAASNGALGSGAVTVSGGTLNLGTSSLANTITLSSGFLAGSQLNGDKLVLQGGEVTGVVASGALSKTGNGTVTLSGANTYAGGTTVSAGTLVVNNANALGAGSVTLSGGSLDVKANTVAKDITLTSDSAVAGTNGTISGVISGSGLLTKVGSGALTLSGNNTFAGGVLVNAGILQVNGEVLGNLVVSSGAKLAGSGIVHDVTIVAGGSINAGGVDSVGTLRADSLSLQGGAKVELNLSDASLGAGNGFDRFLLTGQLDLSAASSANKYSLILSGLPSVFDAASDYSFAFLKYGSLNLGANTKISDLFTLDVSGLKDQTGGALDVSKFSLVDDVANQQVLLNYGSPIPEPSTYGLSLGCLGLAVEAVRRRRRMSA